MLRDNITKWPGLKGDLLLQSVKQTIAHDMKQSTLRLTRVEDQVFRGKSLAEVRKLPPFLANASQQPIPIA